MHVKHIITCLLWRSAVNLKWQILKCVYINVLVHVHVQGMYCIFVPCMHMYADPENTTCFGGEFGQFITKYFLGYEMMIIASFKNLLPQIQGMVVYVHKYTLHACICIGSGYVKNLLTGSHYYYRIQWMGKWRYIAGLLPALFFVSISC